MKQHKWHKEIIEKQAPNLKRIAELQQKALTNWQSLFQSRVGI